MNTTATPGTATTQATNPSGAPTGDPASAANIAAADAAQLQALGYTSKFDRSMSQLENFSLFKGPSA